MSNDDLVLLADYLEELNRKIAQLAQQITGITHHLHLVTKDHANLMQERARLLQRIAPYITES